MAARKTSNRTPLCGLGINDSDYVTQKFEYLPQGGRKMVWCCPYYQRWQHMIKRCYSSVSKAKRPSYEGRTVCDEWLTFNTFKSWMETQDWEGNQLDKDLLVPGNKVYSPETCMFVPQWLNSLLLDSARSRGSLPLGVSLDGLKYKASLRINNKLKNLGRFEDPLDAHLAWQIGKADHCEKLMLDWKESSDYDEHTAKAVMQRIEFIRTATSNRIEVDKF